MRWLPARIGFALVLGTVASAAASAAQVTLTVRPTQGSARARFFVTYRSPAASGTSGGVSRRFEVTAAGPLRHGCASSQTVQAPPARAGETVKVALPPGGSRRWCAGRFSGRLVELISPVCREGTLCPLYIAARTVGHFSFRVT